MSETQRFSFITSVILILFRMFHPLAYEAYFQTFPIEEIVIKNEDEKLGSLRGVRFFGKILPWRESSWFYVCDISLPFVSAYPQN